MNKIKLTNDGEIDIATGRSRKEVTWKNKTILWSEFVKKVSTPYHTDETYLEYISSKKEYQDNKKDVGGYVGGYLNNGRRKTDTVLHRSLITLDMDFGDMQAWEDWKLLYGYACCAYSTHKHTPEKPRLRIVLPLSRPVSREEYEPIARHVADQFGIELFDETTYEAARLMYWQSTSKDAPYFFDYCDGSWIDADEILESYHDWTDSSSWKVSDKVDKIVRQQIKKQEDPTEKEGVVGAFCRTYDVHEAIAKFLSDEYEACDIPNRYTYKKGSTSAGMVVYDGKFAYSHHGTDPTGGKLCNAFDLVRIHKFILKDEGAKEGTPINKLPSTLAMLDFATADSEVKLTLARERAEGAKSDFVGYTEVEGESKEEVNEDWMSGLDVDRKGNIVASAKNCEMIMLNDKYLKGAFKLNCLRLAVEVVKQLPWRNKGDFSIWRDSDEANIWFYMDREYGFSNKGLITAALMIIFDKCQYHPVKEYLNSLPPWDGEERIKKILPHFLGVEDNDYTRKAFRMALTACVARVFQPGIKYDYVLTLVGKEGTGKSTIFNKLGGEWFSDNFESPSGKEGKEQVIGVWIMEISELAGMYKADLERIKSYITTRTDRFRPAYGKNVIEVPRQCVFFATTNNVDFLRGNTGNRRFLPISVRPEFIKEKVFSGFTEELRGQVWSEALHYYKKGEELWLGDEIEKLARELQEQHREADPWENTINSYADTLWPTNWKDIDVRARYSFFAHPDELQSKGKVLRDKLTVEDIWVEALGGLEDRLDGQNSRRIREIMRKRDDFEEKVIKVKGVTKRGFYRVLEAAIKVTNG